MIKYLLALVYYAFCLVLYPLNLLWRFFFATKLDMTNVNKVVIVGLVGGSGKTTVATNLENKYGITRIGLDRLTYGENWMRRSKEDFEKEFREEIKKDKYVLDGVFSDLKNEKRQELLEEVMNNEADLVLYFYTPSLVSIWRKLLRSFKRATGIVESGAATESLRNVINMTKGSWNQFGVRKKMIEEVWKGKENDKRFVKVSWPFYVRI